MVIQQVPFSSADVTAAYKDGELVLDPVSGMQGTRKTEGSTFINFSKKIARFKMSSGLTPEDWENLIYSELRIFGEKVRTSKDVHLESEGVFDWGTMKETRFSGDIKASQFILSEMACADNFSAHYEGLGSTITVTNAHYGLYGGEGVALFSVEWEPGRKSVPYSLAASAVGADVKRFISYYMSGEPASLSGLMDGKCNIKSNFSFPFFDAATGEVYVDVQKGQLKDLPLFHGFSRVVRKLIPSFSVFSINKLNGNFVIANGAVSFDDLYFGGELISAKGKGLYDAEDGFDALLEIQIFRKSPITKIFQIITSPLTKLFKIKLEGPFTEPNWKLDKFTR